MCNGQLGSVSPPASHRRNNAFKQPPGTAKFLLRAAKQANLLLVIGLVQLAAWLPKGRLGKARLEVASLWGWRIGLNVWGFSDKYPDN